MISAAGDVGPEDGQARSEPRPARRTVREPEVSELRAFCAAATLGSIAAAARSLHVSQPALSKRLRALEAVAGTRLFERSTRGVTLTNEGAHLYGAARRVLMSADSVHSMMTSRAEAAPVRIASTPVIAELRLPQALAELAGEQVSLAVEVLAANSAHVREMLREERVDLGIAAIDPDRPPEAGLRGKVLWRDEVVVAVPPDHPWINREEIPLREFARTQLVQADASSSSSRLVAAALDHAGLSKAPPFASLGTPTTVIAASLATGRPGLVSLMALQERRRQDLAMRRVEGMRFDREFALIWRGAVPALGGPVYTIAQHLLDLPFARSRQVFPDQGRP